MFRFLFLLPIAIFALCGATSASGFGAAGPYVNDTIIEPVPVPAAPGVVDGWFYVWKPGEEPGSSHTRCGPFPGKINSCGNVLRADPFQVAGFPRMRISPKRGGDLQEYTGPRPDGSEGWRSVPRSGEGGTGETSGGGGGTAGATLGHPEQDWNWHGRATRRLRAKTY